LSYTELVANPAAYHEAVAIHEGGHAAAAVALGLEVLSASIGRATAWATRDGWESWADVEYISGPDTDVHAAIVSLAGPEASKRWCPDRWQPGTQTGSGSDFLDAARALDRDADRYQHLGIAQYAVRRATIVLDVRAKAEQLVAYYWPEVQAIARALLEARTLHGDTVRRVFNDSFRARRGEPRHWRIA
jgi:hypothetical protein